MNGKRRNQTQLRVLLLNLIVLGVEFIFCKIFTSVGIAVWLVISFINTAEA